MDFMSDALYDGRRIKLLTIVDNFTRENLAIELGQGIRGDQVVRVLEGLSAERGLATTIRLDNGPEFTSKVLDKWAYENGVVLDFSRPGKPTDNGYIESFNGRFREECLNANWFLPLEDAKDKIEDAMRLVVSEAAHGTRGFQEWLMSYHGKKIRKPVREDYYPDKQFTQWHLREVFQGPEREVV